MSVLCSVRAVPDVLPELGTAESERVVARLLVWRAWAFTARSGMVDGFRRVYPAGRM